MTTIRYDFVASGGENVERVFDNIDKRAEESAKANERAQRKTTAAVRSNALARERVEKAPVSRTAQLARTVERDQERAASRQTQRHRALLRSQISAGEQAGRAQARQNDAMRRLRERHDATEAKAHERRISIAKRAGEKQGRETGAAMAKALSSTQGASFGGIIKEMFSGDAIRGAIGKLGSIAKGIGLSALGTGAALFTGVATAGAKDAMRTQEIANRVSINSRMAGQEAADPTTLRKEFEATAIANPGQKASDIGEAVQAYVTKTGDLSTARKNAGVFATVASATGGNVQEIAGAAADIAEKLNIRNVGDMKQALASLTMQGKAGAFELGDAARLFPRLLASGASLGVQQNVNGLKQIGGFAQIARGSTGNGEQATTAIENVFTALKVKAGELEKVPGVKVYEGKGQERHMRSFTDIIADAVANVGGSDLKKKNIGLTKIFGEQGIRALNPLITSAMGAMAGAKGVGGKAATDKERIAAAHQAVADQFSTAINAPGDWSDIEKDAAQAQQDTSAKLTAAWEKITAIVGEKLLPVIAEFAERISENTDLFDAFKTALQTLVQMLTSLGVIKKKTATQERDEARDKAIKIEEKRAKLQREIGDKAMTPEQIGRAAQLTSDYNAAAAAAREAQVRVDLEQGKKPPTGDVSGLASKANLSKEDYAAAYLALGAQGGNPAEQAERRRYANEIAGMKSGDNSIITSATAQPVGMSGEKETQAQIDFRRQQAVSSQTDTAMGGAGEGLGAAAKALLQAAAALQAKAGNQPTTVATS